MTPVVREVSRFPHVLHLLAMGESSHNGTFNANAGEAPDRGGWAELDERLYKLDDADVQFLLDATGMETPAELKEHILGIQAEAYAVSTTLARTSSRMAG